MASTGVRPDGSDEQRHIAGAETTPSETRMPQASAGVANTHSAITEPTLPIITARARLRHALAVIRNRYPELPPAPQGWFARACLIAVALLAISYVAFFSAYLFAQQNAYLTHAEDLGIMDQALWTTTHGAILHQTICNIVSDTNCLGNISRFAIHFEPIMLAISLLYYVLPSPKTLQFLQALVVASGAFPTFWIASRRLRSSLAGVAFALVYLLYPALQAAVTYDFHAVTLSAAFLMFAFYFMLTRNNWGLLIACLLVMSTKEEAPLDVLMIGLSVAVLQQRWRVGKQLVALSIVWILLEVVIMRYASPLGASSTASRFSAFEHHPLLVLRQNVFGSVGAYYLRTLLSPAAYLPALSPLTVALAVPVLAINMLSSDSSMHSGIYHYNAEIAPVLVFASIQSVATLSALGAWLVERAPSLLTSLSSGAERVGAALGRLRMAPVARIVMVALTVLTLFFSLYEQRQRGYTPLAKGFTWPQTTTHAELANTFLPLIPQNASVSAQSDLVPHLSQRHFIYLYPYMAYNVDYVFLDVTGNLYPLGDQPTAFFQGVNDLLASGQYHVIAARDGYLLLQRGGGTSITGSDPLSLPTLFYSFTQLDAGKAVPHTVNAQFGPSLRLVGYDVSPQPTLYLNNAYITVTTYWQVNSSVTTEYHPELVFTRANGSEYVDRDFPTIQWRPMTQWRPGATYIVRSWPLFLTSREQGMLKLGVRVAAGAPAGVSNTPLTIDAASDAGVTLLDNATVASFFTERVAS